MCGPAEQGDGFVAAEFDVRWSGAVSGPDRGRFARMPPSSDPPAVRLLPPQRAGPGRSASADPGLPKRRDGRAPSSGRSYGEKTYVFADEEAECPGSRAGRSAGEEAGAGVALALSATALRD